MFTNRLNMGLPCYARVEKTVHGVKTHWSLWKNKNPDTAVCKEGHAKVFHDMKGPISIDFLEIDASVNSASYWKLLKQYSPYLLNDCCI